MAYSPGVNCPTPALGDIYDWVPFAANFSPLTSLQLYDTPSDHWMMLDQTLVNVGGQTVGPPDDYTTGAFSMVLSALTPTLVPLINWQPPCTTTYSRISAQRAAALLLLLGLRLAHESQHSTQRHRYRLWSAAASINNGTLAPPPEAPWQGRRSLPLNLSDLGKRNNPEPSADPVSFRALLQHSGKYFL